MGVQHWLTFFSLGFSRMPLIPFTFRLLQPFEVFSLDVNTLFKSRNPFCKDRDLEFYRFTLKKLVNCTAKCSSGFITTRKSLQITLKSSRDGSHPNRQWPIADRRRSWNIGVLGSVLKVEFLHSTRVWYSDWSGAFKMDWEAHVVVYISMCAVRQMLVLNCSQTSSALGSGYLTFQVDFYLP